jgi:hypothetical protein
VSAPEDRLCVVHHFPGRFRVRAERFRASPEVAKKVMETVEGEDGVLELRASPLTGSLVVLYDTSRIQLPSLIHTILAAGNFSGVQADSAIDGVPSESGGQRIRTAVGRFNDAIQSGTRGRLDLRTAAPGTLAGLGLLSFLFGRRPLPAWYDLLFWSFVTFTNLNPHSPNEPPEHVPRG